MYYFSESDRVIGFKKWLDISLPNSNDNDNPDRDCSASAANPCGQTTADEKNCDLWLAQTRLVRRG
jgi:hypothetical protein